MIIGGYERMLNLDHFAKEINASAREIRKIILIGASAKRVSDSLVANGFTNFVISTSDNMPNIVAEAGAQAEAGDAVVLSPGFASFDMFKNFEDRGQQFNEAVEKL